MFILLTIPRPLSNRSCFNCRSSFVEKKRSIIFHQLISFWIREILVMINIVEIISMKIIKLTYIISNTPWRLKPLALISFLDQLAPTHLYSCISSLLSRNENVLGEHQLRIYIHKVFFFFSNQIDNNKI